jgi:hypothetical protein
MTTPIYIRARDPENGRRLVEEWLQSGAHPDAVTLTGQQLPKDLPVRRMRWRSDKNAAFQGAGFGAAAMLVLALLLLPMLEPVGLLALVMVAAGVGGGWWLITNRRANGPVAAQREALESGELLIVVDLPDAEATRFAERVNQRHPELLVLGVDASGSPPFP